MTELRNLAKRKGSYIFILLLIFSLSLLGCTVMDYSSPKSPEPKIESPNINDQKTVEEQAKELVVTFLDVGQADAALIQVPNGTNILIDAGNNEDGKFLTSYLKNKGIEKIHILIGTHPHEDHIGGMDNVIEEFAIGQVIMPKVTHTTKTFEDVLVAIEKKGLKIKEGKAGVKLELGEMAAGLPPIAAEIIAPQSRQYEDLNNYSVVLRLVYGSQAFLFTGDAEELSEKEMLAAQTDLQAQVLKVGHHGSNSSTTQEFLAKVKPEYAIISVGKDNDYGHPKEAVLKRLTKAGAAIYRTDELGTIKVITDGTVLKIENHKE